MAEETKWMSGQYLRDGTTVYALQHSGWLKGCEQFANSFFASVQGNASLDELKATAALFSAAPDLYAALKELVDNSTVEADCGQEHCPDCGWLRPARKALAKARGEQTAKQESGVTA